MPKQSLLRVIKRWKKHEPRDNWSSIPKNTRGVYVLYRNGAPRAYEVVYIGVAGLGRTGGGGVRSRLKSHTLRIKNWTHFSVFEVHDNITREEIRELEALLLGIFRHDPRIDLANKQKGSVKLSHLRRTAHWQDSWPNKRMQLIARKARAG